MSQPLASKGPSEQPSAFAKVPRARLFLWVGPVVFALLGYLGFRSLAFKEARDNERADDARAEIPVRLLPYLSRDRSDLRPYGGGLIAAGERVVFDVNAEQIGVVAIVLRTGEGPLQLLYQNSLPRANEDIPLAKAGELFGYTIPSGAQRIRLCAVAAGSEQILARIVEYLPPRFDSLPNTACLTIPAS